METKKTAETDSRKKTIVNYFKDTFGFTLIEVLVVITLLGLIFSTIAVVFKGMYEGSLNVAASSEELAKKAQTFWELSRALYSSKKASLKNGTELYLITAGGQFFPGVVKAVYLFKNQTLYYYEFPYPYGSLYDYEPNKLVELAHFKRFEIFAYRNGKWQKTYLQKARLYKLILDNDTLYIKTF